MPVLLKDIKRDLERDIGKVGRTKDGSYKFVPPNIVGRKLNDYPKLTVSKVEQNVKINKDDSGKITHTGLVASETTGIKYKVSVEFSELKFRSLESKTYSNKINTRVGGDNVDLFFKTPGASVNPVKLRCQCQDFRHRFEYPLREVDGLLGAVRKYTRKTDPWPIGRPFANSTNKLGICKHLNSFLLILNTENKVKER